MPRHHLEIRGTVTGIGNAAIEESLGELVSESYHSNHRVTTWIRIWRNAATVEERWLTMGSTV